MLCCELCRGQEEARVGAGERTARVSPEAGKNLAHGRGDQGLGRRGEHHWVQKKLGGHCVCQESQSQKTEPTHYTLNRKGTLSMDIKTPSKLQGSQRVRLGGPGVQNKAQKPTHLEMSQLRALLLPSGADPTAQLLLKAPMTALCRKWILHS